MTSDKSRAAEIWQAAKAKLRHILHKDTMAQWFDNIVIVDMDGSDIILGVSDEFFADWFTNNFGDILSKALNDIDGNSYTFSLRTGFEPVHVKEEPPAAKPEPKAEVVGDEPVPLQIAIQQRTARTSRPATIHHGVVRHTFDNFVVGEENRYAFAAAEMVAHSPGSYNPLYIYGDTGIGKTHLIQAVRNEMLALNPDMRVRYASCEEILNDFVDSLHQREKYSKFRSSLRDIDALLVDDVHALANKEQLQEQFFNTFNDLYRQNKQIILTSDKQPCEIQGLEKRLISRFESGVTTEITPPGYEIRLAILRQTADEYMCSKIDPEVLDFLAVNISSSVRRLKGALLRVVCSASATGNRITVPFAETVLHELLEDENSAKSVSFEEIQSKVAAHFGLRISDILSNRRPRNIAEPRMVAMYLCRTLTGGSFPEIGAAFGKNHATVMNAMKKVPELCKTSESLRHSVQLLERQLKQKK